MKHSIIIPYHSNETYLSLCINTLQQTIPNETEIIVVINSPEKPKISSTLSKKLKVISIGKSIGYSKAINIGAEAAKGQYLIFSDCDTVYTQKEWFNNLTSFYSTNKKIGIASSKLINPFTNRIIDFGMALSKYNNIHPFMDREADFTLTLKNRRVQMACSANMIIERDLFMQLGMMDTDLINYYQDVDICLRLKDFKKECWVVANSIVYHKGSSSNVKRDSYRADIKGIYVSKNYFRMQNDIEDYFKLNYEYFSEVFSISKHKLKYLLVDMSTVADNDIYYNIIKKYFDVYDIYELKYSYRDTDHISLIDFLGINILTTNVPILFFVDRFISLEKNALWKQYRNCENDIIVDRNCNIILFSQL